VQAQLQCDHFGGSATGGGGQRRDKARERLRIAVAIQAQEFLGLLFQMVGMSPGRQCLHDILVQSCRRSAIPAAQRMENPGLTTTGGFNPFRGPGSGLHRSRHRVRERGSGRQARVQAGKRHKPYILFYRFIFRESSMTTEIARKPTKKAFHFPTSGDAKRAQRKAAAKAEAAEIVTQAKASEEPKEPKVQAEVVASTKPVKAEKAEKAEKPQKAAKKAAKTAKTPRVRQLAVKTKAKPAKKEKVIRDSFTMPKADHERIAELKRKCLEAGVSVKKSELLRAGIQLLDSASSKRLLAAIAALETVKTGRPAKGE
jgi:hypothetical protein